MSERRVAYVVNGKATGHTTAHLVKRRTHLAARVDELRRKSEAAEDRGAQLAVALMDRQTALVEGTAEHEDVAAAERELHADRTAQRHLAEARKKAEAELGDVEAAIAQADQERETARQEKAAQPHLARAETLVERFLDTVADLLDPFGERQEIGRKLAADLPLVRGLDQLVLDELVSRLRPKLDADYSRDQVRHWLRRMLAGPTGHGFVMTVALPARLQSDLGIVDR